jgi:hypothetical protein
MMYGQKGSSPKGGDVSTTQTTGEGFKLPQGYKEHYGLEGETPTSQASALQSFRGSKTRKLHEVKITYNEESVERTLARQLKGEVEIAVNQFNENQQPSQVLEYLMMIETPEDIAPKIIAIAEGLANGSLKGMKGNDLEPKSAQETLLRAVEEALKSDSKLFEALLRKVAMSCGATVNALRPIFLGGDTDKSKQMDGAREKLMKEVMPGVGEKTQKSSQETPVKGIFTGVGALALRELMSSTTEPLYVQINIGKAHIYVLEQVARKSGGALLGYHHESYFGVHSLSTHTGHQPEGVKDLSEHLDLLVKYTTKVPQMEELREKVLQSGKGASEIVRTIGKLAKGGKLNTNEQGKLDQFCKEAQVTVEQLKEMYAYVASQSKLYKTMFYHQDDPDYDPEWIGERREIIFVATIFDPTKAAQELERRMTT